MITVVKCYSTILSRIRDLPLRIVFLVIFILFLTYTAPYLGSKVSGILASFPFIGVIVGVFTHILIGASAARKVFRGLMIDLYGFSTFFYVLNHLLSKDNLFTAYLISFLISLFSQITIIYLLKRLNK